MATVGGDYWRHIIQEPYEGITSTSVLPDLLLDEHARRITTPEQWERQAEVLTSRWLTFLGGMPEVPHSLDVIIHSTEHVSDCIRTHLSFLSEGDDRIEAYLLQPLDLKPHEKRPAVIVHHESRRGGAKQEVGLGSDRYPAVARELTQRGFITLSPQSYLMRGADMNTQLQSLQRRRPGWIPMAKLAFDASRCVDFLLSLPEVDPKRIGTLGFSLGAKTVLFAMALDHRFAAGVFSEGGIGFPMSNWTDPWFLTNALEPLYPGLLANHQLLGMIAPRPFLVTGTDNLDGDQSWPYIEPAISVYRLFQAGDRIGLFNERPDTMFNQNVLLSTWVKENFKHVPRGTLLYRLLAAGERYGLYRWRGKHIMHPLTRKVSSDWLEQWLC